MELQAADLENMPEFERRIRAQYPDIFKEPTGMLPIRKDRGFRVRTIPSAEPPSRSPYRLTPEEREVYKKKAQALLPKRLIRKSNLPYAASSSSPLRASTTRETEDAHVYRLPRSQQNHR